MCIRGRAPADLPKDGGRFDLAIALGILIASGQLGNITTDNYEFIGELSLNGQLNPVSGMLPSSLACLAEDRTPASYTHLTLPTIYSV